MIADPKRHLESPAGGNRQWRSEAQDFLDEGAEVLLVFLLRGDPCALAHVRVVSEERRAPRDRCRRCLVARSDQGDEIVAQVLRRQRIAVLVARLNEHGQDVLTLGEAGIAPRRCDLLIERASSRSRWRHQRRVMRFSRDRSLSSGK